MESNIDCRRFESPDEKLDFGAHGRVDIVHMPDGATGMHAVLEPGWVWSKHEKPLLGNPTACPMSHTGYCIKGEVVVRMVETGEERIVKSGDLFEIPAGHDAWVPGAEACELIMFAPPAAA
jgi:quercetin dioxygenase-like cupin family protein